MPIYDYHCDHCGHTFSQVQSYSDATLEKCPSCGKRPRKLMATPAIVFKGGGWYKTDSRPKSKEAGSDTPAASETAAKADAPKETKGTEGAPAKESAAKASTPDAKSGSSKAEAASS